MGTHPHSDKSTGSVACAAITVSDTRTVDTDGSGALIKQRLADTGHRVSSYEIIPDDPQRLRERVSLLCDQDDCRVVLVTGGTGLTTRDTSYEAVAGLLEKRIDGFGELFRMLSYEQIGPAAMLSRAVAGISRRTAVFLMPGSTPAVQLAMDKLILPELGHMAWLLDQ